MRRPRPQKPDPAANMFAIGVDAEGNERSIGRVETLVSLRHYVMDNMADGLFTEVAILNLRQLEPVVKRLTE